MAPNESSFHRRWLLILTVLGVVILYILNLFNLQILSDGYTSRAEGNAYYNKPIFPMRGVIYDRDSNLLVSNRYAYDLMITMHEAKRGLDTAYLAEALGMDATELSSRLEGLKDRSKNRSYSPYTPQLLYPQLDELDARRISEILYRFPGVEIRLRSTRQYEYHHAAHLLGYLSEASPSDLKRDSLLLRGEYVGKSGVEKSYDSLLRGVKGVEILLRDSRGRIKGRFNDGESDRPPVNGRDIYLSIDANLQRIGEEMMQGKRGAIVAIEPSSGEILAMVTAPSFDPSLLEGRDKGLQHKLLEETPGKPLLNRAIMGMYPPGSTFKAGQAAVFLAEGALTPETRLSCIGGYPRLGGRPKCHGHAPMPNLVYSLTTSCNSYYSWGMHLILDNRSLYPTVQEAFEAWKNRQVALGFGYKTGIDLASEKRGYIPNSAFYDKHFKAGWNSSTIISIGIGQGEILTTPLQLANLSAIIANRGKWHRPHIVRGIDGHPLDTAYTNLRDTHISPDMWEYVVQGMAGAVTGGTCRAANFAPGEIAVCGKTGTAENPHGKDHSAFIGFAPREQPRIAVAVYVENGGFGARFGVPIGRVMMEYYLRKGELSSSGRSVFEQMKNSTISYSSTF